MKLRLSTYFTVVAIACGLLVVVRNPYVGAAYMVAVAGLLLPTYAVRVPQRFYFLALFTAGTLWIAHMVRPLAAVFGYADFMYAHLGTWSDEVAAAALLRIGLYSFVLQVGLLLGLLPVFGSPRAQRTTPTEDSTAFLVRARFPIILGIVGFFLIRAMLMFGAGIGRKSVETGAQLGFILQLIPDDLVFALGVLYLAKYRKQIGLALVAVMVGVLAGYSILLLIGGSKAFLARIALAIFIYYLASRGDFKIRLGRAVVTAALVAGMLLFTFPLASLVRFTGKTSGFGAESITHIAKSIPQMMTAERMRYAVDLVTRRISGYDGFIAVRIHRDPRVEESFTLKATVTQAMSRLIPGFRATSMTQGKAISVYYLGLPELFQHAGAVGLFGAVELMAGGLALLFLLGLGYVWGTFFRFASSLRNPDLAFILQHAGAYAVLRWSLSGNFDDLAARFLVYLIQIGFYGFLIVVGFAALRRLSTTRPSMTSAMAPAHS
jgi:hypothetical protein